MANNTLSTKIKLRRDTATNWATLNPILLLGEQGLELDTGFIKIGDGSTAWNNLTYQKVEDSHKLDGKTLTQQIADNDLRYLGLSGGTMTGDLNMSGNNLINAGFKEFLTLPTTFQGTQITFGGKVYTWNVAESKYKCDSDYLEIGGRNYLLNTASLSSFSKSGNVVVANGIMSSLNAGNSGNIDYIVIWGFSVEPNTTYTISCKAKTDGNSKVRVWTNISSYIDFPVNSEWKIYSITFNTGAATSINLSFNNASVISDAFSVFVKEPKLEKGSTPTDWTPAPEDKANNFQSVNYALSSEQLETTTIVKDTPTLWQNIFSHTNFLWGKLKDLFTPIPLSTNDGYLTKIDDVNKKLVKSKFLDDGFSPYYDSNLIHTQAKNAIPLTTGQDLNTFKKGNYATASSAIISSLLNKPSDMSSGEMFLTVLNSGSDSYVMQVLYELSQPAIFTRTYRTPSWSAWVKINDGGNAESLDGKTLTQQIADNDLRYLGLTAKAADSNLFDGIDSSGFNRVEYLVSGDWDNIETGFTEAAKTYRVESPVINPPLPNIYNWSLYQQGNSLRGSQLAIGAYGGNEMLFRGAYLNEGSWRPWCKVWHSNNFDPATKLDTTAINGTQNYLTKYGATGITQSNIFDNGSSRGLGTAIPLRNNDLRGTFGLSTPTTFLDGYSVIGGEFAFTNTLLDNGNNGYLVVNYPDNNTIRFGTDYDGHYTGSIFRDIQFGRKTTPYMTIKDGGNVGIGTTEPLEKLQVAGNIYLPINNSGAIKFSNLAYPNSYASIQGINTSGGTDQTELVFNTAYGAVGERMRITTHGNVGIGTTAPAYKLDVNGGIGIAYQGNLAFKAINGTSYKQINVDDGNDGYYTLRYISNGGDADSDVMHQWLTNKGGTYNTAVMSLTRAGNVGISTINPSEKLDVNGYIKALSGFKKGSLDDSRMLLAGGGDKLLSDFSLSGHLHTGVYLGINDTAAVSYNSYALDGYSLSDFPLLDNGKIQAIHLPDYLLGQVLFGGTIDINLDCTITLNCQNKYRLPSIENIGGLNAPDYEGVYFIATDNITVGTIAFEVGDWVISNGISWIKIDNTDAVSSVNGQNGAVVITLASLNGQPLDADLTAIAALTGTSGFLRKTAADTWALDGSTYLSAGETLLPLRLLKHSLDGIIYNSSIQESGTGGFVGIDIAPDTTHKLLVNGLIKSTSRVIGNQLTALTTSTMPLLVSSNIKCDNLNVDYLDGYHAGNAANNIPISNLALCTNLNADLLDGQHGSYYAVKAFRTLKITDNSTTFIPLTSEKDNDITIDNNVLENTKFEFQAIHVEDSDLGDGEWESVREYTLRVKFVTKPSGLDFTFITDGPFTQFYKSLSNFTELENINADEIVIYTVKYVEGFGWLLSNEIFRPV